MSDRDIVERGRGPFTYSPGGKLVYVDPDLLMELTDTIDAERALADDLAAELAYWCDHDPVLARYREARR